MTKIPEFPSLTRENVDPADELYIVDKSDTTDNASGTSKKTTVKDLLNLPTASDLSGGTNLQDYIWDELRKPDRVGPIYLPKGNITFSNTLHLKRIGTESGGLRGVRIEGAGSGSDLTANSTSWGHPDVNHGTTLIFDGSADDPMIRMSGAFVSLSHMSLQHYNASSLNRGGVGISLENRGDYGATFMTFDTMEFLFFDEAFVCGKTGAGAVPGADLNFRNVSFRKSNVGFRCYEQQGVSYSFSNMCYWTEVDTAIDLVQGGNVFVHGCASNGVNTFLKSTGGSDGMPCVINGMRFDRTGGSPIPVIIDATPSTGGGFRAVVDGWQITNAGATTQDFIDAGVFRLKKAYVDNDSSFVKIGTASQAELERLDINLYAADGTTLLGYLDQDKVYTAV